MKRKFLNVIVFASLICSSIVLLYSLYNIFLWFNDNINTKKEINKINSNFKIDGEKNIDVSFKSLLEDNNETVGWLIVRDTSINYPVVKHDNNDYYLTHSFDKSYNKAGWIFMDYRNSIDMSDRNTIIYGHNRKDGSMFGSLNKVLSKDWIDNKENLIIEYITNKEDYKYQVFSVYKIFENTDYMNIDPNQDLLDLIRKRSIYDFDIEVNKDDKILTLQTCYDNSKKIILHAKKI